MYLIELYSQFTRCGVTVSAKQTLCFHGHKFWKPQQSSQKLRKKVLCSHRTRTNAHKIHLYMYFYFVIYYGNLIVIWRLFSSSSCSVWKSEHQSRKMKIMFPATSASILKFRAIPKPQMVWDGKRSPIKFLIIISPAESGVVAAAEVGGGRGVRERMCVCVWLRSEDWVGGWGE